jgi:CPA1 family monovalent cation:H+ antiporter
VDVADVASINLFADLDEDERGRIAAMFHEATVWPGRKLADQGEFGYRFFVILDGTAVVRIDGEQVATAGPGDFFGEMALLDEERRTAVVEAQTGMHIGSLMIWDFRELLEEHPQLAGKVEATIAERRSD